MATRRISIKSNNHNIVIKRPSARRDTGGEFHGSCIDPARNGEASYADPNGAIDAAVKAKLDNYQHDYSERIVYTSQRRFLAS